MSKTVYRTILTFMRPNVFVDFFPTTPEIEAKKSEYRTAGKILGYYGANSDDGLTRTYTVDFVDEAARIEFRNLVEVDTTMQSLVDHNDTNSIITTSEEGLVQTVQYD
jgi:hypothetical protein